MEPEIFHFAPLEKIEKDLIENGYHETEIKEVIEGLKTLPEYQKN